jgi:hypothetical protein
MFTSPPSSCAIFFFLIDHRHARRSIRVPPSSWLGAPPQCKDGSQPSSWRDRDMGGVPQPAGRAHALHATCDTAASCRHSIPFRAAPLSRDPIAFPWREWQGSLPPFAQLGAMQQNGDKNELLSAPGSNLFPCCIDATQLSEARCRGMDPRLHAVHDGAAMRAANTHDAHDKKDGGRGQCNFNTSTFYSQLTTPMYNNLTQPLLSFTRPKKKVGGNNHHE